MKTISKKIFYAVIILLLNIPLFAQQVDFDRVIVPAEFRAKTFEDYLVQLAWNNSPSNKVLHYEVAIAKEEENIQRWDWTKGVSAQFNYNEAHFISDFNPPAEDGNDPLIQSLIFPRFNLGARFDLGTLLNFKNEKQISKLKTKIAQTNIDQEKLTLRAKVLEQYADYIRAEETMKLRLQAEEEASQTYQLSTALFKAGETKLEDFTSAATSYFNAKEATLNARSDMQIALIKLEEFIGVSFEDAKKYAPKEITDFMKKKGKK